ncbi:MAG: hypothetical protein JWM16_2864 [Verrucomicrobiales bacterium]|nr:hypothetical protein [Verrucomicrobiales bacterium]
MQLLRTTVLRNRGFLVEPYLLFFGIVLACCLGLPLAKRLKVAGFGPWASLAVGLAGGAASVALMFGLFALVVYFSERRRRARTDRLLDETDPEA